RPVDSLSPTAPHLRLGLANGWGRSDSGPRSARASAGGNDAELLSGGGWKRGEPLLLNYGGGCVFVYYVFSARGGLDFTYSIYKSDIGCPNLYIVSTYRTWGRLRNIYTHRKARQRHRDNHKILSGSLFFQGAEICAR